jgi:hypothetical protein
MQKSQPARGPLQYTVARSACQQWNAQTIQQFFQRFAFHLLDHQEAIVFSHKKF